MARPQPGYFRHKNTTKNQRGIMGPGISPLFRPLPCHATPNCCLRATCGVLSDSLQSQRNPSSNCPAVPSTHEGGGMPHASQLGRGGAVSMLGHSGVLLLLLGSRGGNGHGAGCVHELHSNYIWLLLWPQRRAPPPFSRLPPAPRRACRICPGFFCRCRVRSATGTPLLRLPPRRHHRPLHSQGVLWQVLCRRL